MASDFLAFNTTTARQPRSTRGRPGWRDVRRIWGAGPATRSSTSPMSSTPPCAKSASPSSRIASSSAPASGSSMIRLHRISRSERIGIAANSAALKARNGGFWPGASRCRFRSASNSVSSTSSAFSICARSLPSGEGAFLVEFSAWELGRDRFARLCADVSCVVFTFLPFLARRWT